MRANGRDEADRHAVVWAVEPSEPAGTAQPNLWRRIAWLVVGATSLALVVVVFAAVRMAGPDGRIGRLDAFPGVPTGGLLTPQQPETGEPAADPTAGDSGTGSDGGPATAAPAPGQDATEPRPSAVEQPRGQQPGATQPTGRPGSPAPTTGATVPSGSSPSPTVARTPPDVVDATYRFFGYLPEDPESAWQMLSPRSGYEEFRAQWQQYSAVELQYVTVGADGTTVVATLSVTEYKGATTAQRWKLIYEVSETAVISQVTLLERAPQDPGGNKPFQ